MRMMERMADFSHILTTRPDFDDEDREWLHHLVADWQVIADLSFADLLLILQNGEGKYIIAEQCRPSTVMSLRADDVVGDVVEEEMSAELDAAMASESVFRSTVLRTVGESTVCNVYAPVRHNGKTLGLVVRETNMATRESNGRYESESISAGKQLYEMIPRGQFPYRNPIMNQRHNARVADGFIVLTVEGIVRYASPNAISCFRRLGSVSTMQGEYLSEIGTKLLRENDPVLETLPLVLSGKAAVDSELDANKSAVSMRSLPLMDANGRVGAVVLCRDVTELRRREKELQTKDATISEIHHRVKNNLQAVSALLRLQARKTKSEEVKKELKEAQRRVQTIAMVHEGLSQTADEIVDYDKVISSLLKMAVDLATMRDQHIDIDFIGRFGMMPAQDATPLSLVLTELITNSVEHGFEGRKEGHITISVGRGGNNLNVVVEDDGTGLANEEHDGMARSSGSGLGTQIISTFVNNDFGGTVRWEPRRGGGTRVVLDMKLRAAQERYENVRLTRGSQPDIFVVSRYSQSVCNDGSLKISDLHLHGLGAAGTHGTALERTTFVFAQTAPNTVILIGVKRALQARVNHLAGAADGLGLFDLLIGGACIADREKQLRILVAACGLGAPVKSTAHIIAFLLPCTACKSVTQITTNRATFQESSRKESHESLKTLEFHALNRACFGLLHEHATTWEGIVVGCEPVQNCAGNAEHQIVGTFSAGERHTSRTSVQQCGNRFFHRGNHCDIGIDQRLTQFVRFRRRGKGIKRFVRIIHNPDGSLMRR